MYSTPPPWLKNYTFSLAKSQKVWRQTNNSCTYFLSQHNRNDNPSPRVAWVLPRNEDLRVHHMRVSNDQSPHRSELGCFLCCYSFLLCQFLSCNALALMQCVASHPQTKKLFLNGTLRDLFLTRSSIFAFELIFLCFYILS